MAAWIQATQNSRTGGFEGIEQYTGGYIPSPKQSLNLMQNCDLPPPMKLFSGAAQEDDHVRAYEDCPRNDKLEILKALRLSQSRAIEAERKLKAVIKEKEELSNLIVDDSLRLFAYQRLVHLLEFQVLKLQRMQEENMQKQYGVLNCKEEVADYDEGGSSKKWCAAIAFCLAIAGIGFYVWL